MASVNSADSLRIRVDKHIVEVATELLGQPNEKLSNCNQLRFGTKGSLAVEINGGKAGRWYDHERGVGGDGVALICDRMRCNDSQALMWAHQTLPVDEGPQNEDATSDETTDVHTKVEKIVQSSTSISGTPAELYLHNRGITADIPDCVRFRPNAYDPYGAVVALATDNDGDVLAVHQIYVTEDGRKAPLEVVKRTNKRVEGWSERGAVHLPGIGPPVLAEGVETALSVWQATGHETLACLGIANIGRAPLLDGAEVIVARDGDAPDSPAAEQLQKSVNSLRRRGFQVRLAEPPLGKDFNDVLVEQGEDPVRAFIEAASVIESALKEEEEEAQTANTKQKCEGRKPKAADVLIGLAEEAELFHAPDGTAYADLTIKNHRETWSVRSKGFKRWLSRCYYEETNGAPNSEALQSALNVIEAKAHYDGPEHEVHVRVAGLDGRIYLDLADDDWRVIEIDENGWRIEDVPPVKFRRSKGMLPLPMPQRGGSVDSLRPFLNVHTEQDFVLAVTWLHAALRNVGPYPVLALSGEQGTAKSTVCAILRALIDPNTAPLRALPREDRDLFIAAKNAHLLAFDNVSHLSPWISDTLCRLATGGGFAVRQLHTDEDEVLFDAQRPVILNGIEDIVGRPDLADRALFLTLEPIAEECRRSERELWSEFEKVRPKILGALLDAVAAGLRALPDVKLDHLPRMADFAIWGAACETDLLPKGTFAAAYEGNRDSAIETVIENDPVSNGIRELMANREVWAGTATKLLDDLCQHVDERLRNNKRWPSDAKALSGRIRRAATFLRKLGIDISHERENDKKRTRIIHIKKAGGIEEWL